MPASVRHRVVFELPCLSAASLPLLPALVVRSFQLVQSQKCQMPNQRPSWGQVVLSPTSALVLWGFCESSRTETCSAERAPGLGECLGHSSSAERVPGLGESLGHSTVIVITGFSHRYPWATTTPSGSSPRPSSCQLEPGDSHFLLPPPTPHFSFPWQF